MTQQPPGWDPYRQAQGGQQPYGADPYGQPSPYGQPPAYGEVVPYQQPGYQQPTYQQPGYQPAVYQAQPVLVAPPTQKTSGLAVASMVCALVGVVFWYFAFILEILALIFGIIAKKQIKERDLKGGGMATAGIVISAILLGLEVLIVIGWIALFGGVLGLSTLNS